MTDGVTRRVHPAPRGVCGTGYVILSHEQPIPDYIASSFRNNRISIITEQNEIVKNCIVSRQAWQTLEFPTDLNGRGSAVVWINVPFQNRIVILDTLNKRDELNPIQTQHNFSFQRKFIDENGGTNKVVINGDGLTGTLTIVAEGTEPDEGAVFIKILSSEQVALFDLYVQGKMNINVENEMDIRVGQIYSLTIRDEANPNTQATLTYQLGTGYTMSDEFGNNIKTNSNGIFHECKNSVKVYSRASASSSEPGLLGNKTYTLLNEIKNLLTDIVNTLQIAAVGANVKAPPIIAKIPTWLIDCKKMQTEIAAIKAKNFELS